jgi:branched-chain amino acid aminotransferase
MKNLVWLNGRLVLEQRATIGVWEPGCAHGEGLFETLRIYGGVPFRLVEHLRRLRYGARALDWRSLPSNAALAVAVRRTIAANRCRDGVLRIMALAAARPVLSIRATSRLPYSPSLIERGCSAVIVGPQPSLGGAFVKPIKVTSYIAYRAALRWAQQRHADEGLFVDRFGRLTEGTRSSLFIVSHRGQIVTPPLASGILAGVTRHVVSDLARRLRLPLAERPISPPQLFAAREVLLTSSLLEVAPLVRVDGRRIGSGRPGLTARLLQAAYRRLVVAECGLSR